MQSKLKVTTSVFIEKWTTANFLRYVQYEAMFFDKCTRLPDNLLEASRRGWPDIDMAYILTREGPGYSGFPTKVEQTIYLVSADTSDGEVPLFDPETDTQNMSAA